VSERVRRGGPRSDRRKPCGKNVLGKYLKRYMDKSMRRETQRLERLPPQTPKLTRSSVRRYPVCIRLSVSVLCFSEKMLHRTSTRKSVNPNLRKIHSKHVIDTHRRVHQDAFYRMHSGC
jgi:hypothetical protein